MNSSEQIIIDFWTQKLSIDEYVKIRRAAFLTQTDTANEYKIILVFESTPFFCMVRQGDFGRNGNLRSRDINSPAQPSMGGKEKPFETPRIAAETLQLSS